MNMVCPLFFLRNPVFCVLFPSTALVFAKVFDLGFVCIVLTSTTLVLVLTTLLFTLIKQNTQEHRVKQEVSVVNTVQQQKAEEPLTCMETNYKTEEDQDLDLDQDQDQDQECRLSSSSDIFSDENEWPNLNMDSSDGSISDEESLFEISLQSLDFIGYHNELKKSCSFPEKKFQEFTPSFQQHSLMELFADFNEFHEEENMIEIDISMGSIKYSRFEIEA